jgi:NADH dehydrogenase
MNNDLVTVFGASGFLGRHCVRALAKKGYRIRAVTRRPNLANHLPPMGQVGQIQLFKGDVRNEESIAAALRGAHHIVNLTGILYQRGEQSFEAIHVAAPKAMAESGRLQGARSFVHVSALGADSRSESHYARTKAKGEAAVRAASPTARIIRPSIVFGSEDAFFNRFAELARTAPALPLIGGGRTRFQPVFAGDVAAAIVRALEPTLAPNTYELGGPGIYSFRELMTFILEETGRKRLLVPIPFALASVMAFFLQLLPSPLLTPDQVKLLRNDNVVGSGAPGFAELGIVPTSIEAEVPAYLWRFRPMGQYSTTPDVTV